MNGGAAALEAQVGDSAGEMRRRDTGLLHTKTLVLNRSFLPIHVTSVRRACVLLFRGVACAVNPAYETFDFPKWCEHGPQGGEVLGLDRGRIQAVLDSQTGKSWLRSGDYYCLPGRARLFAQTIERAEHSRYAWPQARSASN